MEGVGVGRIVHYMGMSGACLAAIVTGLSTLEQGVDGVVDLHVFIRDGDYVVHNRKYDPAMGLGTWHWPEKA